MILWALLVVGTVFLVASVRTLNELQKHQLDKSADPAEFPDRHTFYRMNLFRADGYTDKGQSVLRTWLLLLSLWFITWLAALFMFGLRDV